VRDAFAAFIRLLGLADVAAPPRIDISAFTAYRASRKKVVIFSEAMVSAAAVGLKERSRYSGQ
jgi:hypothetical protein